jgi:hypothetical protein
MLKLDYKQLSIFFQTQLMANIVPRSNGNVTLTFNNGGLAVREARRTTYDTHLQPGALVHFPMAAAAAAAANYQPLPSPAKHVVNFFLVLF